MTDRWGQEIQLSNPCAEQWVIYALRNTPLCDIQLVLESIDAVYPDGSPVPRGNRNISIVSALSPEETEEMRVKDEWEYDE